MLGNIAKEAAERFGDTTAYVSPAGWEVSYRDLDRLADEVAVGLRNRGVGEGDVVALVLPQTPEYFVNGRPLPSFGLEQLQSLVREELQANYR